VGKRIGLGDQGVCSWPGTAKAAPGKVARGAIPVMTDGDLVLTESFAINLYLARRYGGDLGPRDAAEDALMRLAATPDFSGSRLLKYADPSRFVHDGGIATRVV
jgi:hypothetical protein